MTVLFLITDVTLPWRLLSQFWSSFCFWHKLPCDASLHSRLWFQKKITDALDKLCGYLPPHLTKTCKDDVDRMLPIAITFLTTIVVRFSPTLHLHHYEGWSHHRWLTDDPCHFLTETCWCLQDDWPLQLRWATAGQAAPVPGPGGRPVRCHGWECQFDSTNGSFVCFNVSDLMSSTISRVSPPPTAPSASSWSRLWISSSPKTGLRCALSVAMSRCKIPTLPLHLSPSLFAGSRHPPAGEDLQDSAALPQGPVWVCDQQVQQVSAGRHPELCHTAGCLLPFATVQRAGGSSWRSVGRNKVQKLKTTLYCFTYNFICVCGKMKRTWSGFECRLLVNKPCMLTI